MMKKTIPIFILFFVITLIGVSNDVCAQNVIRGTVIEKESGEPIPGATVAELDANNRILTGNITDINGNYVINVRSRESRLQYSFIGYESQTIAIGDRITIDIELSASYVGIDEVVVTATMETDPLTGQSLRDRTSATARIDMDELRSISGVTVDNALQGQVSGLDIMSGGSPGSGSSIVIRGLGSLGDATPLIVVNGIEQNISISADFDFSAADQEDLGQLLNIAPQDIKSIEVLKDAASTAVWGSRGANGVLLIETHAGTRGKTVFNYNYRFQLTREPPPVPMLNGDEYITMQLEQYQNALGLFVVPDEIAYNPDYFDFHNYSANTDWLGAITQSGMSHDHFFSFSGGGDKTTFYASLNAAQEDGTTLNEAFGRLTSRIRLNYILSSKINFQVDFDYTNSYREGNYRFRGTYFDQDQERWINVRQMAYQKSPNMSIWEYDQSGNITGEYFTPINSYQGSGLEYFNPVAIAALSQRDIGINRFNNSYRFNYRINRWLRLEETVTFQYENQKNMDFLPYAAIGADWLNSRNNESTERNINNQRISSRTRFLFTPVVTSIHSLTGVMLLEIEQQNNEWSQVTNGNGPSMYISDPAGGMPVRAISSNLVENRGLGTMANVNYKYLDKYLLTVNLRADASSSFGRNNRWGFFPSLSLGWRFSSEDFMSQYAWLNNGMLRAGWGQAGRQIQNPYFRFGLFSNANPNLYITNPAIIPTRIDLTNLRWETVESYNLGVDLSLLDNRLQLTGDLYDRYTSDILWPNYSIPASSGFNSLRFFNGGKIRNYGWEASARYIFVRTAALNLTGNFNIAHNINAYTEFPDNFNNIVGTSLGNTVYPRMAQIGQPVGSFYGFRYLGVYSTTDEAYARDENGNFRTDSEGNLIPMQYTTGYRFVGGDPIYEDINHDGMIDIGDVVYLGDSNPRYTGGFGLNVSYRQFSVSSQFMYKVGFDIVNEIAMFTEGMNNRDNQSTAVLRRWRNEGDDYPGMLPRAYFGHPANNLGSDRYVEKGDFLKLNALSGSYRLKRETARRIGVEGIELGFNMRKIWTLTRYSGQDPEIPQRMQNPFWFGKDDGQTPTPRFYNLFINLRF
jgi:TonB-linked SusC/RagA family outer membrane protein